MAGLKYWLWLTEKNGMGAGGAMRVLNHFLTPEQAYYADPEEYQQVEGLTPYQRKSLLDKKMDGAEKILADCQRLGLRIMTIADADYPARLAEIHDPPVVLYIKGRVFRFDEEVAIGVVGAREPSEYGGRAATKFGLELTRGGALVVSGIAQGIDCLAVKGALKAGGPVVSVLAGGIDVPYPASNRFLYQDVAAAGALISEYPPGTMHKGIHFPVRNRIISGLSLGVLAVECKPYGGTMLTVQWAIEQNRDVFAVPGAIDAPMSRGGNSLIRQGAILVEEGEHILEEYYGRYPLRLKASAPLTPEVAQERLEGLTTKTQKTQRLTPQEELLPSREIIPLARQKDRFTDDQLALIHAMGKGIHSADQLVELTQIPVRRVQSALTMLQVDAAVEEHPGRRFSALVELE